MKPSVQIGQSVDFVPLNSPVRAVPEVSFVSPVERVWLLPPLELIGRVERGVAIPSKCHERIDANIV